MGHQVLSRRDSVTVAWQFTARNAFKKDPSRRVRSELVCWHVPMQALRNVPSDPIIPFPPGRVRFLASPGSKLPGYLHLVPPGRNPGHLATFLTPPPCFIRVLGSQEANGGNTLVLHSHITREAHALGTNRGRGRRRLAPQS